MHILVTGAAGRMGNIVVAHLQKQGHIVRAIDAVAEKDFLPHIPLNLGEAEYREVDILDTEAVAASCENIDALVHLAGIPHYTASQSNTIFQINAGGTFNLYQAAADIGIGRIVSASSINYLGNGFGAKFLNIEYFPVDEAHPSYTLDAYAFSKQILEEIADFFWRKSAITTVCFRFPMIYSRYWLTPAWTKKMRQKNRSDYEMLMALPQHERVMQAKAIKDRYLQLRTERTEEKTSYETLFNHFFEEPGAMLMFGVDNFWAVLNDWDAAKAIELALTADLRGNYPLFLAEQTNSTGLPSRDLASLFYPEVQAWKRPCSGTDSLLNAEKAKLLLGFTPTTSLNERQST